MNVHILDASAMVAYLSGEPGAKVVDTLLNDPDAVCYAHSINLCEVFYDAIRKTTVAQARQTIVDLRAAGVIERRHLSRRFWQRVGRHCPEYESLDRELLDGWRRVPSWVFGDE